MRNLSFLLSGLSVILISSCATPSKRASTKPLESVDNVDLQRYLGTWYEIARFPFSIQKGCFSTTATYSLRDDQKINVLNKCYKNSFDGKETIANGTAEVVDKKSNSKLKVSFNFFMSLFGGGDYWIVDLAPDYSYAVVSEPKGRYLWILSRQPVMDSDAYQKILDRLKGLGFLVEYLEKTPQRAN